MSVNSWETKRLDEVATIIRGVTYSSGQVLSSTSPEALMLLRATNIQDGKLDTNDPVYIPRSLVKPAQMLQQQDILIASSSGSIQVVGKSASVVQPLDATFGAFCTGIRATGIDPKYLAHYLQDPTLRQKWSDLASGSNINNLKSTDIASTPIPVPPLDEQRRIVETLDDHLSRLEKALAEAQYSAKATMRFSASLLHSMFTGDLMQRELGLGEPNITALAEVAEVQSGGTPKGLDRLSSETASGDHTVPFYKVGDMNHDARYMKASRSYLTPADIDALRLKVIPSGSVVFPKAGGAIATDKKRLVQVPGPIDLNCMAVIPGRAILPTYLAWWFESFKLSDLSNGSILPQIGKTAVMQVQLPIPPLADQEKVVQYLEENISLVRAQARSIDGVVASISTLRRSVLHDALSGKLVDRY